MNRVIVIGSGASGVHFALRALELGWEVTLVDLGKLGIAAERPELDFDSMKKDLDDPLDFFLGRDFSGVLLPTSKGEYYGFPPHKQYIFEVPAEERIETKGFDPLRSYAAGGLAEAWTGGSYPLNDQELELFPFDYKDLEPHYSAVAKEIGISGSDDDTARWFPVHDHIMDPVAMDRHSEYLKNRYDKRRDRILRRHKAVMGRSRTAVLSRDMDGREACDQSGRCLWGCPKGALYVPSITLEKLKRDEHFTYLDGLLAEWLEMSGEGHARALIAKRIAGGGRERIEGDRFVLAAGTLNSTRIFLDTWLRWKGEVLKLGGLMDNRQIMMPFLTPAMIGKRCETHNYQYHQLMLALKGRVPREMVHCQITTLTSVQLHAILQNAPVDLRGALEITRQVRTALGLVNINLNDTPRKTNYVTIKPESNDSASSLVVHYEPPHNEHKKIRHACRRVKRVLRMLGSVVPPGMTRIRPMGASVHYAGTLPMSDKPDTLGVDRTCRSYDIANLYLADGSSFCDLPAKNLTFTLMANARRIASESFRTAD